MIDTQLNKETYSEWRALIRFYVIFLMIGSGVLFWATLYKQPTKTAVTFATYYDVENE